MSFLNLGAILTTGNVQISLHSGWISPSRNHFTMTWNILEEVSPGQHVAKVLNPFFNGFNVHLHIFSTFIYISYLKFGALFPCTSFLKLVSLTCPLFLACFTSHGTVSSQDAEQLLIAIVQGKHVPSLYTILQWNACSLDKSTLLLSSALSSACWVC